MKHTLLFYGDSNTWGYDPASFTDGRYPVEKTWPALLAGELEEDWEVIPRGLNGRMLPARPQEVERVVGMAARLEQGDVFGIMLGTNDIGMTQRPDAAVPAARMERLLQALTGADAETEGKPDVPAGEGGQGACARILVIAPCWIGGNGVTAPELELYREECRRMNAKFAELAGRYGAFFADAAGWQIGMAFDFIHFSLAGHRQFAYHMKEVMARMAG